MNPLRTLFSSVLTSGRAAANPADFGTHAAAWWDESGPMAPLHRLNPVRLAYLKQVMCQAFKRDVAELTLFKNLKLLDIGCGGGLVSEPLARLGGTVTGIDSSADLIAAAQAHAAEHNLSVTYRPVLSDVLVAERKTYDVVLALEVIEHVEQPESLLNDIAALLQPNGIAILSTLNRTPQSFLKGIVAAEYLVRWVPRGTHDWQRFLKPHELAERAQDAGLQASETMGLHYDALQRTFALRRDRLEVNYFMVLRRMGDHA
jgi:2-polyprenyl-6-hydroxyphenyl methylase/3-demethylubiquinone-9 3-methyltransferase